MNKPTGEQLFEWVAFKKKHPDAIIRTLTVDSHQLRIAAWGPVIGYRKAFGRRTPIHKFAMLQSTLHPVGEIAKCGFVATIRRTGKLKELLMRGAMPLRVKSPANPPPKRGTPPLEITYTRGPIPRYRQAGLERNPRKTVSCPKHLVPLYFGAGVKRLQCPIGKHWVELK